ncbi:hypothetical protein HPB49_024508 [Dermacentor silvarum]|uniref:Uncharacterized protein n=1 Tax=Dermacentor silvarum TaxID=543639 RepID=A0ACB8CII1_DERSI|nr:hypothetical protein HPB49_024508 [Dermacentor silvarum]
MEGLTVSNLDGGRVVPPEGNGSPPPMESVSGVETRPPVGPVAQRPRKRAPTRRSTRQGCNGPGCVRLGEYAPKHLSDGFRLEWLAYSSEQPSRPSRDRFSDPGPSSAVTSDSAGAHTDSIGGGFPLPSGGTTRPPSSSSASRPRSSMACRLIAVILLVFVDPRGVAAAYYGVTIGPIKMLAHGFTGNVFAASEKSIYITDMNYDGKGPAAFFVAAPDATTPPDKMTKLEYDSGKTTKLDRYTKKDVTVTLPADHHWNEFGWFSVYCMDTKESHADIAITKTLAESLPVHIAAPPPKPADAPKDPTSKDDAGTLSALSVLTLSVGALVTALAVRRFFAGADPRVYGRILPGAFDRARRRRLTGGRVST